MSDAPRLRGGRVTQMSPAQLWHRVEAVNRTVPRAEIEGALAIVHLGHTRLGDVVQATTNLRCLKKHLRIRHMGVNLIDPAEYRLAAEVLKNNPLVGRCENLPYEDIPYWAYQVVLHYTV